MCMDYQATRATRIAGTPFIGANTPYHAGRGGYLGAFIAWDAGVGKKVWQTTEPFPVWSGAVVTAGDVVFYGTLDGWFKAADTRPHPRWDTRRASSRAASCRRRAPLRSPGIPSAETNSRRRRGSGCSA